MQFFCAMNEGVIYTVYAWDTNLMYYVNQRQSRKAMETIQQMDRQKGKGTQHISPERLYNCYSCKQLAHIPLQYICSAFCAFLYLDMHDAVN